MAVHPLRQPAKYTRLYSSGGHIGTLTAGREVEWMIPGVEPNFASAGRSFAAQPLAVPAGDRRATTIAMAGEQHWRADAKMLPIPADGHSVSYPPPARCTTGS